VRRVLALGVALCLAVTVSGPVAAGEPYQVLNPKFIDEATVAVGETVVLETGWAAKTGGMVIAFSHAAEIEWSIGGEPLAIVPVWSAPWFQGPAAPFPGTCFKGTDKMSWRAAARAPAMFTEPGTYMLTLTVWTTHPVVDGGDYDCDGVIDKMTVLWTDAISLTVVD
jgi:hypothetical protein